MLEGTRPERFLCLSISVIDKEETAAIEPEAFQAVNDPSESIKLLEKDRNLPDEKTFAIVQEGCQYRFKFSGFYVAAHVLVLCDVCLSSVVPDLRCEQCPSTSCFSAIYITYLHTTDPDAERPARRTVALLPLTLLFGKRGIHPILSRTHLQVKNARAL